MKTSQLKRLSFSIILFLFFAGNNLFASSLSFNGATVNSAQTICSGSTPAALTLAIATCAGATQYTISAYEWQESNDNGVTDAWAIAVGGTGATTSSHKPRALTAAIYYRCKITVSNLCVGIVSPYYTAAVKITVNAATTVTITAQPTAKTVCAAGNATFSVTATGTGLTYQWQNCATATGVYSIITGATAASYTVAGSSANNGYYYQCKVGGFCAATKTSTAVKLTVNSAPSITVQPTNQSACVGGIATFNITASGTSLTYQWQKSTTAAGASFSNISGATSSSYSFTAALINNNFNYRCIVSGTCTPAVTSASASLTINSVPSITTQPINKTVCAASNATFSVVASGTGLTYQWQKSTTAGGTLFSNISGATSSNYDFTTADIDNNFNYRCIVSGTCTPAVTSASASLTIKSIPSITVQPTNQLVCAGSMATFSITASGPGLTYQWQKSATPNSSYVFSNISGATSSSYSFTTAAIDNNFNYRCIVSGTCTPSVTSDFASLTVNSASITVHPINQSVSAGSIATFSITASGTGLTYQWQKSLAPNSVFLFSDISGATNSSYSFTTSAIDNNFNYRCIVSGTCPPAVTSGSASVLITSPPLLSYTAPTILSGIGNPGGLNTETDTYLNGWTALTAPSLWLNAWSPEQTLPENFPFLFFGETVTEYKVTSNGLLTFNTSTVLLPSENNNLPSPLLPNNTIACFWDAFAPLGPNDVVYYKLFGTAPNRQLWIKWHSMMTGITSTIDNSYACVLEETTNKIYFVDMYNPSAASPAFTKTVGLQYIASNAVQFGDNNEPLLSASSANSDNYYYEFIPNEGDTQAVFAYDDLLGLSIKGLCLPIDDNCAEKTLNSAFLNVKLSTGDIYNYGSNAFTETVEITLTPYLTTGTGTPSDITLEIDQSNPLQLYRLDISDDYENLIGYKVKVTSITSLNNLVHDNLEMKAYYTTEFGVDVSNVTLTTIPITSPTSSNPVTLEWTTDCDDVPGYKIKVLRLYNTSTTYDHDSMSVSATVDWDDALEIIAPGNINSYTLSLTEGSGYYMWKVGPIGSLYENGDGDSRNRGNTSEAAKNGDVLDINGVADLSSTEEKYIFYYNQFSENKSWIYDRVFTEDGKVSENIVFADGLGLARQKQHKMQENDEILASQTLYDYVGRAAVNTMMAPIEDQNKFQYIQSLVEDTLGNFYGAEDFDSDFRYDKARYPVCAGDVVDVPTWENPVKMYGPINDYYSDENPDLGVPNAENYPYSRTVFHKDGREKKTSLFGAEHRMGLYDETYMLGGLQRTVRTYYSSVSDTELIKVFGNETPADTGIYKIIRVDPNEVPTVEYKTLDGKTIATCMINTGDHPLLDDISEVENIITQEIKGNRRQDPYTLVKEKVITFTDPTIQLDVDYVLELDEFEANCISYCSTCDYIVTLYIIREETKEVKWSYTDTLGPNTCGGDLNFDVDSGAESLANFYDATCPQMVLEATDVSTIMLSDPGNYRIGRRMTVNGIYDGEARYRDYHADTINALLYEEAAKFDPLFGYLDTASGSLTSLYAYLDGLQSNVSSACNAEANIETPEHHDVGYNPDHDIWEVSYVANEEDTSYGTYTLASSCLEIEVPKIPCDFNPCDALWKHPVNSTVDWKQDLITKYGGYYDFESMLLTDENKTTYGDDLYKYFYDKYGNYKYPINRNDIATITIKALHDPDNGWHLICFADAYDDDDGVPIDYDELTDFTSLTVTLDPDGDGGVILPPSIYTPTCDQDWMLSPAYDDPNSNEDFPATYHPNGAIMVEDFGNGLKNQLATDFASYGYEVEVSFTYNDVNPEVTTAIITISNDFELSAGETAIPSTDHTIEVDYENLNVTLVDFTSTEGVKFPDGNGAFNSMITHMVMEPLNGSNEDAYDYDCYDMYLIWEEIVNDYDNLKPMFGTDGNPGIDLLEYFLEKTGKVYGGYSNHEYGNGDKNAFLTSGLDQADVLNDDADIYGYGYLEYAYKSFQMDFRQTLTDAPVGPDVIDLDKLANFSNCAEKFGVDYYAPIDTWTNPVGTDDNGDPIWNSESCGLNAWWSDNGHVIKDKIDEVEECKAWGMLHECINADLALYVDAVGDMGYGSIASCTNSPDATCVGELGKVITNRTIEVLEKSDLRFANTIRLSIPGTTDEQANATSTILRDKLYTELYKDLTLTVSTDANDNVTRIGTVDELALFHDLQNKKLNVSADIADMISVNSVLLAGGTYHKSELIAKELNLSFARKDIVVSDEVSTKIENIYGRYGWDTTNLFTKVVALPDGSCSRVDPNIPMSVTADINSGIITLNGFTVLDLDSLEEDETIETSPIHYEWGAERAQVTNPMRVLRKPLDCDSRNLTYIANQILYALDDAKECRLETSLANYDANCTVPSTLDDELKVSYSVDYHQYTLFYYDIAGNLVKVVPPKGVDVFLVDTDGDGVRDATPSRQDVKNHKFITKYKYNSLGQCTYQETPDGGVKQLYYNSINQLRFAQNEKQAAELNYEYYKYDNLGNLIEAGLCSSDVLDNAFVDNIEDADYPYAVDPNGVVGDYSTADNCFDRMVSVYGDGSTDEITTYIDGVTEQTHVDGRIQYTYSDFDGTPGSGDEVYTDYSYDPHGNVQWMLTAIPGVAPKYIYYEYDLITGQVTEVKYNEGKTDQFYHRYFYDADNRVTKVETSHDGILWDTDAQYEYYAYGPMKRLSIGADHIQGIDYVYTINGWLKANNHQSLNSAYDPGGDGSNATDYAKDVFGMTLGYFDGDFKRGYDANADNAIDAFSPFNSEFDDNSSAYYNTGVAQFKWDYDNVDRDPLDDVDNTKAFNYRPLFNGTITNVVYGTQAASGLSLDPYNGVIKGMKYKYDELYRLTESNFDYFDGEIHSINPNNANTIPYAQAHVSENTGLAVTHDYNTAYTYDLMGNIETLTRYGDGSLMADDGSLMDMLTYHYQDVDGDGTADNNRLSYIDDAISSTAYDYAYDLEDQSANNYTYNEIGELIDDNAEGISDIEWTRTGKVKRLSKISIVVVVPGGLTTTTYRDFVFAYDAMDKRVSKMVFTTTISTDASIDDYAGDYTSTTETTYYVYDAKGQVISTYKVDGNGAAKIIEQPIYAGSRIGMEKSEETITLATNTDEISTDKYTRSIGDKSYEIKDYLGNVRGVVSDAKERTIVGLDTLYTANLISSCDYMPYGMIMPHTDNSSSDYRYGYQGMEKDDEIKDGGNSYDFGARFLDPRVGRWLSLDPKADKYPDMSPYNAMGNNPINAIDPDGRDVVFLIAKDAAGGHGHMGALIQDGDGNWYYTSKAPAPGTGRVGPIYSVKGEYVFQALNTQDVNEAFKMVEDIRTKENGHQYTDQVQLETTSEDDDIIYNNAAKLEKDHVSGDREFHLLFDNCADASEETVGTNTGIALPPSTDPRPNRYFEILKSFVEEQNKIGSEEWQKDRDVEYDGIDD